jgi:hypothetical protein
MNMKLPLLLAVVMIGSTSTVLAESGGEHPGRGEFREKMRNHMEQKIKETDTNGDGSISKAEFLAKAEKRFAKMDQNGDQKRHRERRGAPWNSRHHDAALPRSFRRNARIELGCHCYHERTVTKREPRKIRRRYKYRSAGVAQRVL